MHAFRGLLAHPGSAMEGILAKREQQVCLICAKPSSKAICDACADRLRGEALEKKKKEEKV